MLVDKISQIELELTTKCNARCPQCIRNYYGSYTWPSLPIVDLDINTLKQSINSEIWENLDHLRLCGTYGDPCMHKDLIKIVKWIKTVSPAAITINSNGGIRNPKWWGELAGILDSDKDTVVFGLDGLADTNHLHRIGVNYNKVIENLKAFNQAGGKSVWQFLVFEHNEHQVDIAREFALSIGCAEFSYKLTSRFVDKTHKLIDKSPVMNNQGEPIYFLKPAKNSKYKNQGYDTFEETTKLFDGYDNYLKTTTIDCFAKRMQYIAITAEGYVFPCAWLADRLYGYETEKHKDHETILKMIDSIGGKEKINLKYTDLNSIISGPWFELVENSWKTNELERCAHICGSRSGLIQAASEGQFKSLIDPKVKK
jgi:MoaA/NifB/PqqE/SkfB family radical SAM enzyme